MPNPQLARLFLFEPFGVGRFCWVEDQDLLPTLSYTWRFVPRGREALSELPQRTGIFAAYPIKNWKAIPLIGYCDKNGILCHYVYSCYGIYCIICAISWRPSFRRIGRAQNFVPLNHQVNWGRHLGPHCLASCSKQFDSQNTHPIQEMAIYGHNKTHGRRIKK